MDVWSDRNPSLQSRHFLIQVLANIGFDCLPFPEKPKSYCFSSKIDVGTKHKDYCARFCQHATKVTVDVCLNERANIISEAMHVAAEECYTKGAYARKPWVSQEVLQLIELRQDARKTNNYEREQELHKQIKRTVKDGRKNWLTTQLVGGNWKEIKSLKKGPTKKPLQVRGADNILVSSENRADTLADYFEHIQWKI